MRTSDDAALAAPACEGDDPPHMRANLDNLFDELRMPLPNFHRTLAVRALVQRHHIGLIDVPGTLAIRPWVTRLAARRLLVCRRNLPLLATPKRPRLPGLFTLQLRNPIQSRLQL